MVIYVLTTFAVVMAVWAAVILLVGPMLLARPRRNCRIVSPPARPEAKQREDYTLVH